MQTHTLSRHDAPARMIEATTDAWSDAGYSAARRITVFILALASGVVIAGFWSPAIVDGWGRQFAAFAVGGHQGKAAQFATLGGSFGILFGLVAGLAATFTACNCVVYALVPSLAASGEAHGRRSAGLAALGAMVAMVVIVSAVYGAFVGRLGPVGAAAFTTREIRSALSFTVFGSLGIAMMLWSAIAIGLCDRWLARCSPVTRAFFAQPTIQGALVGLMVGAFSVGRPFPVFREFLLYAAQANRVDYAAGAMIVEGVGQIMVVSVFALLTIAIFGRRIRRWMVRRPHSHALISAVAMATSGAFFVFYWCVARSWPQIGRWGVQLGWYR